MMPHQPTRRRLDRLIVDLGLAASRARARDAIKRGGVTVDGALVDKPGALVDAEAEIRCNDPAGAYVSRAALKLLAGLDRFGFDPSGRVVLDIGASTGGFTEVLLQRGAVRVYAYDVGRGQLHPRIAGDRRVVAREGFNIRELTAGDIREAFNAIVCDVSFISLKLAAEPALKLAAPGAWGVFLVKPQFEVGRDHIGKGGIVRDRQAVQAAVDGVFSWLGGRHGWRAIGIHGSPIDGGDGNREFLLGAVRDG